MASVNAEVMEPRLLLVPSLSLNNISFDEGDAFQLTTHQLTLTLSEQATQEFTVYLQEEPGTAQSWGSPIEQDYASGYGYVQVPVGSWSVPVAVFTHGDQTPESDETFSIRITGVTAGRATIADGLGEVTILNDDGPVIPTISIGDRTLDEGNSGTTTFSFTVSLSSETTVPVTVDYATTDYSATSGSDYTSASGTVTFSPGATTQTVTVNVSGDTTQESTEAFFVDLSNPTGGVIGDDRGVGTIANDDNPAVLPNASVKATHPTAAERASDADRGVTATGVGEFTIHLSSAPTVLTGPITVNYSISGSANGVSPGLDYTITSATSRTFGVGVQDMTVQVTPIADGVAESLETVVLTLVGGSNYNPSSPNAATVVIGDYGTLIFRAGESECSCACDPPALTTQPNVSHSDEAAKPTVPHIIQTTISPNDTTTSTALPEKQLVELRVRNREGTALISRDFYFSLAGHAVGDSIRMGVEVDLSTLPTDVYQFEYTLKTLFADATSSVGETTVLDESVVNDRYMLGGNLNSAHRPDYGFGDGWSIPGMKALNERDTGVPTAQQGVSIDMGSGQPHWFQKTGTGTYESPHDFFGTLVKTGTGFTLTDKNFTRVEFNLNGRLQTEKDRNDRVTSYTYGINDRLESVTDSFGRSLVIAYNATTGLVDTLTDADNRVTTFHFDAATGRLQSLDAPEPDGLPGAGTYPIKTEFTYDANGRMTFRKTTENGTVKQNTEYRFDSRGRMVEEIHHDEVVGGAEANWDFAPVEASSGIVDGSDVNAATTTNPAALMNLTSLTSTTTDTTGAVLGSTFDWDGHVLQVSESHDGGTLTTQYEYDDETHLLLREIHPAATLASGGTQTLEYHYTYDDNGNLTSVKTVSDAYAPGTEPIEYWGYDTTFSQPVTYEDARGYVTVYLQDTHGNITRIYDPLYATDAAQAIDSSASPNTNFKYTELAYYATGTAQAGMVQSIKTADPDGSAGAQARSEQQFTYDSRGNLLTVIDVLPTGNLTTAMTYSGGTNRLRTVTNEDGKVILDLSSYMATGLSAVTKQLPGTANERKTFVTYDGMGNVVTQTLQDPDGAGSLTSPVYQYVYDARGRLIQEIAPSITVVLPNGTTTTQNPTTVYAYDLEGNLASITDPLGAVTSFVYEVGQLVEAHLPDPDGAGSLGATVVKYDYDERHQLTSKIIEDPANSSIKLVHETYIYNAQGQLTESTDVLRSATTKYEYDLAGNLTAAVDALNRRTTYAYNSMNLLTSVQQPHPDSASSAAGPLWQYQYDQLGRLISSKDPLLHETKYEYDLRSQMTKVTLPDPDGAGSLPAPYTTYAYTSVGELDKTTDHLGRVTDYTYDDLSQLTRMDLPDPDGIGTGNPILSMSYGYDRLGRTTSQTDQRGQVTSYAYNAMSWLTSTTLPDPDGASGSSFFGTNLAAPVMQYGYDANGNLRTQDAPGPNGTLRTTNVFDAMGRATSVIAPQVGSDTGATATTSYKYDAISRLTEVTDALANVTSYAYDPGLRTRTVTEADPDGAGPKTAGQTVSTYDKVGNLTSLKDASNNTTTFTYDQLNRLTTETTPFVKSLGYEYDFDGNLTRIIDRYSPNGRKQDFSYDALDRVTKETWRSATTGAAVHSIYYTYDTAGRVSTVKELRGGQAGTPAAEYVYAYDNLDRLTTVTDTANFGANSQVPNGVTAISVILTHTYNSVGDMNQTSTAIATIAAPTTPVADYVNSFQYDNMGRTTQIVQGGTAATGQPAITRKRVDLAYNAAGQFSKIVRASGASGSETETATSAYSYFAGGGMKQIDHTHSGASSATTAPTGGTAISSYAWTYDTAGRVSSFSAPEGSLAYGYDNTNQLTSSTFTITPGYTGGTPAAESFSFDATGNRTGGGYTVDKNRMTSDGTFNYAYDNEGNLFSKTEIATGKVENYFWDHRNRLTKVEYRNTAGGALTKVVTNSYDVYNQRVMKQVDTNGDGTFDRTERYVWDGGEISLVLDQNGNVLHRFLHGPAIDQIFADESSVDGLLWDLTDNQGTVRDVVNNSGTVVNHLTYSSFGKITSESNTAKTPFFGYTGRDWDKDLNLQYNRGRWYDPKAGRWLGEDPIRFAAGDPNLSRYVSNSPTNYIDPSGLAKIRQWVELARGFKMGIDRGPEIPGGFEIHVYGPDGVEVAKINGAGGYVKRHGGSPLPGPSTLRHQDEDLWRGLKKQVGKECQKAFRDGLRPGPRATRTDAGMASRPKASNSPGNMNKPKSLTKPNSQMPDTQARPHAPKTPSIKPGKPKLGGPPIIGPAIVFIFSLLDGEGFGMASQRGLMAIPESLDPFPGGSELGRGSEIPSLPDPAELDFENSVELYEIDTTEMGTLAAPMLEGLS